MGSNAPPPGPGQLRGPSGNYTPEQNWNVGDYFNAGPAGAIMHLLSGSPVPSAPDYVGAAEQQTNTQTQANRPDITTPFANQHWEVGPDGKWRLTTSLTGGAGEAADSLNAQLADLLKNPLDLSSLPALDYGEHARDQAIQAAYGQATSRLNPQWNQRGQQQSSSLANAGLDPNSQAYRNAMRQFNQGRNDAYGSAMNSAIGQGTAAGNAIFQQSIAARQNALGEMLKKRGLPLEELGALQGLTGMPGFHGASQSPLLQALMSQDRAAMERYGLSQSQITDLIKASSDLLPLLFML